VANRKRRKRSGGGRRAGWAVGFFVLLLLLSLGLRHRDRLSGLSIGSRVNERSEFAQTSTPKVTPEQEIAPEEEKGLRLQVLNATGVNRLALDTGDRLRHWGVDTLDRGNAPAWPFPETLLLVRTEQASRLAVVERLAERLGGVPVLLQRRGDLVLDATLLLGHDWEDYHWPEP
jgi:hypothetical protein